MTLDEKLKEFEVNNCDSLGVEVNCQPCWELLAALKRCREQRDYYQDQLCDLDVGSYGTPIEDDAELLALLEGEK